MAQPEASDPLVALFEVLSPSTEAVDRGGERRRYPSLPSQRR